MGTDKQEKWSISCSVIISHNMTVARHATCYMQKVFLLTFLWVLVIGSTSTFWFVSNMLLLCVGLFEDWETEEERNVLPIEKVCSQSLSWCNMNFNFCFVLFYFYYYYEDLKFKWLLQLLPIYQKELLLLWEYFCSIMICSIELALCVLLFYMT